MKRSIVVCIRAWNVHLSVLCYVCYVSVCGKRYKNVLYMYVGMNGVCVCVCFVGICVSMLHTVWMWCGYYVVTSVEGDLCLSLPFMVLMWAVMVPGVSVTRADVGSSVWSECWSCLWGNPFLIRCILYLLLPFHFYLSLETKYRYTLHSSCKTRGNSLRFGSSGLYSMILLCIASIAAIY